MQKKTNIKGKKIVQIISKKSKKKIWNKSIFLGLKKYSINSLIFALMMTIFNHIYMLLSLYTTKCSGIYIWLSDDIYINVIFNTLFDVIFFFITFNVYAYLFLEMLLFPKKVVKKSSKKRV